MTAPTGPAATVIIVNWNRAALLESSLRSLASPQGISFTVILVDNGSSDDSLARVAALQPALPYPLEIIRNAGNLGFCAANNQGIARAQTELIALLNNDAEADPGWLGALAAAFADPSVGMAASKVLVHEDPRVIDKAGHLIYLDGQNRGRGSGEWDDGRFDRVEEVLWPDGCAAMYRKSMLDRIGGFDEDFFAYADDAELGLRARIAGWRCLYIPAARVRHRRGATLGQTNLRRISLIERNRVLLAAKLFPGSLLWPNAAYYLARLVSGAIASAQGRGEAGQFPGLWNKLRLMGALLRGDLQALPLLPRMWRKRQALRPLRRLSPQQTASLLRANQISLRELNENRAAPR